MKKLILIKEIKNGKIVLPKNIPLYYYEGMNGKIYVQDPNCDRLFLRVKENNILKFLN